MKKRPLIEDEEEKKGVAEFFEVMKIDHRLSKLNITTGLIALDYLQRNDL